MSDSHDDMLRAAEQCEYWKAQWSDALEQLRQKCVSVSKAERALDLLKEKMRGKLHDFDYAILICALSDVQDILEGVDDE